MEIVGKVTRGSGIATETLKQQTPWFVEAGIPNDMLLHGSINIDISPSTWSIVQPDITLTGIEWRPGFVEDFNFVRVKVLCNNSEYPAYLYNPMRTKNPKTMMESVTTHIKDMEYGQEVAILFPEGKVIF